MRNRVYSHVGAERDYERVLCVCSAGILRSPTAALVLSQEPYSYNTRSAGTEDYALIPVTQVLVTWAEEIVCMMATHKNSIVRRFDTDQKPIIILDITDSYDYREQKLMDLIRKRYDSLKA